MRNFILSILTLLLVSCGGKNTDTAAKYQYIDDLKHARVGALMGSIEESLLEKRFPGMEISRYETITDMVQALKQNRVDAVGMDGYCTPYMNRITDNSLASLDDSLGIMGLAAAFPKGQNKKIREQFNKFIAELKKTGEYEQMVDKWINHSDTAQMPDLEWPSRGKTIKVATCPTLPPTSFLLEGKNAGLDMEILQRFAIHIGCQVEIFNLNFTSLITSVNTGKTDMIMSSLIKTKERAEAVDFSDSYMDFRLEMLIRAEDKAGFAKTAQTKVETKGGWISNLQERVNNNMFKERRYMMILNGLKTTIIIAFLSAIFGTILGAIICFMKMRKSPIIKGIANVYITVMRGMPVLVLLLIMFYVVFNKVDIDPVLVSVITFSMNFAAYVSEMFRTSIEGVDRGQTEAGIALGFTKIQTFIHIVLPQAFKNVLPVYKGEMISMVKMTSIVGYIAVEDLTRVSDIIRSRTFDALFPLIMVAILYFVLAWLFTVALDYIGRKVN